MKTRDRIAAVSDRLMKRGDKEIVDWAMIFLGRAQGMASVLGDTKASKEIADLAEKALGNVERGAIE